MKKFIFVPFLVLFLFSMNSYSSQADEDRLSFVRGEIKKIEKQVEQGASLDLVGKFLNKFKAEEKELVSKLKETTKVVKPTKEKKPIPQKKTVNRKRRITPKVKKSDNITTLKNRLYTQRKRYLRFLNNGEADEKLYEVQANIQQLEILIADLEYQQSKKNVDSKTTTNSKGPFSVKGHMQFRTESARNNKGVQGSRQTEQSFFRLRSYFTFKPNDKLALNLTPQATKGFGANDSSGNATSGSTNHTEIDFFEANLNYKVLDKLTVKLGRQEISYGDHLVVGALPWANTGRSFDALKLTYDNKYGSSDLLYSKINDNATSTLSTDDQNFFSYYNSFDFGPYAKNLDLYYMQLRSGTTSGLEVNSFGFRLKGSALGLFYRTENSIQNGANLGDDAFQYDIEVGKKFKNFKGSIEYAVAGANYRQFFPTAHKFLGFADVLGRRNVKQVAFHLWAKPLKWMSLKLDYHIFKRDDTTVSAFRLNGATAIGSTGSSDDIGNEIDFIVTLNTFSNLKLQLGTNWFNPGAYMRQQDGANRDKVVNFNYVQVLANF